MGVKYYEFGRSKKMKDFVGIKSIQRGVIAEIREDAVTTKYKVLCTSGTTVYYSVYVDITVSKINTEKYLLMYNSGMTEAHNASQYGEMIDDHTLRIYVCSDQSTDINSFPPKILTSSEIAWQLIEFY